MELENIFNQSNLKIIDVREVYEFESGHAKNALNIPLGAIPEKIRDFRKMGIPIVVYCRSGMRSARAVEFLKAQGIQDVFNGGSLDEVLRYQGEIAK